MVEFLTNIATLIGMLFLAWYGSLFAIHAIKASILSVAFWRWSTKGIASEHRKQKWWQKFYIIVMWFKFFDWRPGCQSIEASYGKFYWWGNHSIRAQNFKEQTTCPKLDAEDDDDDFNELKP